MKRLKESVKNHHPYCQDTYLNKDNAMYSFNHWDCRCELLKAYDKWRGKKK